MMLTDLIYYDLKVAALIAVFYLFYQLLLARETMHRLNRAVLLTAIALSAVLPLCVVTIHRQETLPTLFPTSEGSAPVDPSLIVPTEAEGDAWWLGLLAAVLLSGIIVRLLIVARTYWKLHRLIARGEHHTLPSGTRVCVVEAPVAPFSWMHTVVLSRAEWQSLSPSVLAHEEAHVRHRHSYDIVVVEVLTALQWFNPVVWFLRQELRTLHEYEADASVLSSGFDESQYIHLLMQKATGIQACALANGINTHRTKKRIMMMLKPKSNHSAWLKALYVVPVVLSSLALSAETVIDYKTEETITTQEKNGNTVFIVDGELVSIETINGITKEDIVNVDVIKNKEFCSKYGAETAAVVIIKTKQSDDEPVFNVCEQLPQYPGGQEKMMEFLMRNMQYPQIAKDNGVQGRVLAQFIVEKDGRLSNVKILDSPQGSGVAMVTVVATMPDEERQRAEAHNAGVQALRDEAVRVINAMPKWEPGKQRGQAVRCKFTLPVTYRLN